MTSVGLPRSSTHTETSTGGSMYQPHVLEALLLRHRAEPDVSLFKPSVRPMPPSEGSPISINIAGKAMHSPAFSQKLF